MHWRIFIIMAQNMHNIGYLLVFTFSCDQSDGQGWGFDSIYLTSKIGPRAGCFGHCKCGKVLYKSNPIIRGFDDKTMTHLIFVKSPPCPTSSRPGFHTGVGAPRISPPPPEIVTIIYDYDAMTLYLNLNWIKVYLWSFNHNVHY